MLTFLTTIGDTSPIRDITLQRNGTAIDLTAANTVNLIITKELTGTITNAANQDCVITSGINGIVSYSPVATDFPTEGRYTGDAKITLTSGKIEHVREVVTFVARDHK